MKQLTARYAAERIGLSVKRVYALIAAGKLHAADVSTGEKRPRWRISEAEIERFLARLGRKRI